MSKIIFMGTSIFAVPILKSLYQNGYPISVVYTSLHKNLNVVKKLINHQFKEFETLSINFRSPTTSKDNKEEYEFLKELDADLAVVVAYGQIIPKEFLELTKKGLLIFMIIITYIERCSSYSKSNHEFK